MLHIGSSVLQLHLGCNDAMFRKHCILLHRSQRLSDTVAASIILIAFSKSSESRLETHSYHGKCSKLRLVCPASCEKSVLEPAARIEHHLGRLRRCADRQVSTFRTESRLQGEQQIVQSHRGDEPGLPPDRRHVTQRLGGNHAVQASEQATPVRPHEIAARIPGEDRHTDLAYGHRENNFSRVRLPRRHRSGIVSSAIQLHGRSNEVRTIPSSIMMILT